ncbi:hypothetical protein IQ07DRAFT_604338 [Pyrenochaeta sp. DS3sAY3a]|nr:hypothetical protein IQ07DRAFT_604338 [Pyrenochaeta sp. DS3sAY3a]
MSIHLISYPSRPPLDHPFAIPNLHLQKPFMQTGGPARGSVTRFSRWQQQQQQQQQQQNPVHSQRNPFPAVWFDQPDAAELGIYVEGVSFLPAVVHSSRRDERRRDDSGAHEQTNGAVNPRRGQARREARKARRGEVIVRTQGI